MVGRSEQHVGQRVGLVAKSPPSKRPRAPGGIAAAQRERVGRESFVTGHGVGLALTKIAHDPYAVSPTREKAIDFRAKLKYFSPQ